MDHFVFLFPDRNHIDWDSALEMSDVDRKLKYLHTLNACIDSRYRKNGFKISHVLLNGEELSRYILKRDSDDILFSSMSLDDMKEQFRNKANYYIDTDEILSKLAPTPIDKLVIGGFYLTDCVDKFASDAYDAGLDALVDEDITDMLLVGMDDQRFKIDKYPNRIPIGSLDLLKEFFDYRKDRPWLWQLFF